MRSAAALHPSGVAGRTQWQQGDSVEQPWGEDRSRIRTNPGVFARLRSFAFNILKPNPTGTLSQDRYRAALAGIDRLIDLVNSQR